jgi:heat shock protein HspQ
MGKVIPIDRAKFSVGDIVHHRLFGYRGVIFDADSSFQLTEEWYDTVARSRPPKDRPWYHVLVEGSERNLERDPSRKPIDNPMVDELFTRFENGRYVRDLQ